MKKEKIVPYYGWFIRVVSWFKVEFKPSFYMTMHIAAGVAASFLISFTLVSFFPQKFSSLFGMSSFILQIFGSSIVGFMFIKRRHLFNLPDFKEKMKRFPKLKHSPTVIAGRSATLTASGCLTAEGYATVVPPQGAPLEERVAALEANLARQTKRIDDMKRDFKQETSSIRKHISSLFARERNERESDIKKSESIIRELAVGGIKWEMAGFFWLIIGIILGMLGN